MEGKPLVQAFEKGVELKSVSSWEDVPGKCGMHPPDLMEDPFVAQEAMDQLIALGYIEDPGEDAQKAVERTKREQRYNLARVYAGSDRHDQALPIFKSLYENEPGESRFALRYLRCCYVLNRLAECRHVLRLFEKHSKLELRADEFVKKIRKKKVKSEEEKKKLAEAAQRVTRVKSDLISLAMLKGDLLLKVNRPGKALEVYRKIDKKAPERKWLSIQIANAYFQLKKYKDARNSFRAALEIDPDSPEAHHGLAKCFIRAGKYEDAIDEALMAVGLNYHFPFAHYHLGEALFLHGEYGKALQAFNVCLSMEPNIGKARNYLISIFEEHLHQPEKALQHREYFEIKERPVITVVSGLPRSGTSMMMQMLEAGGHALFVDDKRVPDESNLKGYYEHTAVKRIIRDKSWIGAAENHAVKVVSHLIFHLPARYNYKVIFMERDVAEVILSQKKMLERNGKSEKAASRKALETSFEKNLERVEKWNKESHNVSMMKVGYADVLENAFLQSDRVHEFLGMGLNTDAMAAVVDQSLYRVRGG
jgi:tetratricopeptide (TPR) repeat protein